MQLNITEQDDIVRITVAEERMDAHNSGDRSSSRNQRLCHGLNFPWTGAQE